MCWHNRDNQEERGKIRDFVCHDYFYFASVSSLTIFFFSLLNNIPYISYIFFLDIGQRRANIIVILIFLAIFNGNNKTKRTNYYIQFSFTIYEYVRYIVNNNRETNVSITRTGRKLRINMINAKSRYGRGASSNFGANLERCCGRRGVRLRREGSSLTLTNRIIRTHGRAEGKRGEK